MSVMFLHLGNGASVRTKDIIAIYDYEMFRDGDNHVFWRDSAGRAASCGPTPHGR